MWKRTVKHDKACYYRELRIGIHTSRSGALENAAIKAHELGANTFQIFSASPRMWKAKPAEAEACAKFRELREKFDLYPLAIHSNYLINLASLDPVTRPNSIAAFRGELERAAVIGAEYLVLHPGNYKPRSAEEGMAAFVLGLEEAARGLEKCGVTVLLENTVGAGAQLGGNLDELRTMRDLSLGVGDLPVAYCLDTCHLLASGFAIQTEEGLAEAVGEIDAKLGLDHVRVVHANDSKGGLGSHIDRHANIGEGQIGAEGFRRILQHPGLRDKPFILETPVDNEGDDLRNVQKLKELAGLVVRRGKRKSK